MDVQQTLCQAITDKQQVRFYYDGGFRNVESHMVATNEAGQIVLSSWFLSGHSESGVGRGWREYLLSDISRLSIRDKTFTRPRPGYKPDGGKKYHSVICRL